MSSKLDQNEVHDAEAMRVLTLFGEVAVDPGDAERMGAFEENALSGEDATDSVFDQIEIFDDLKEV